MIANKMLINVFVSVFIPYFPFKIYKNTIYSYKKLVWNFAFKLVEHNYFQEIIYFQVLLRANF